MPVLRSLETYLKGHVGLVRAVADDGSEGWGQVSPYGADITVQVFHRQVAPHALGREVASPSSVAGLAERAIEEEYKHFGTYLCRALSGLDTALLDLLGKRAGVSAAELLGGAPRAIPAYASSMRRDISPRDEAERMKRLAGERGFRAFKVRVGTKMGHDRDASPGRTEALVGEMRRALGPEAVLMADGNGCYSVAEAVRVGRLLEAEGFAAFEEPCPYWEIEWTGRVASELAIPVQGGEQDYSMQQWRGIVDLPAVDVVQPDVCYVGGVSRALEVARMAAGRGLPCTPHAANVSMLQVFTMHLLAAAAYPGPYMEYSIEPTPWARGVYEPEPVVTGGEVPFPEGPGWGVRVRADWLEGAERAASGGT